MNAQNDQAFLALARRSEDLWLFGSVQVDEDGNVIVSTLRRDLIQADCLELFQVQRGDGFEHIVADNAPQSGFRDLDMTSDGIDRHLANKAHDKLLEKQDKMAPPLDQGTSTC